MQNESIEFNDGAAVDDVHAARHLTHSMIALVNRPLLGPHRYQADRIRAAGILMAILYRYR